MMQQQKLLEKTLERDLAAEKQMQSFVDKQKAQQDKKKEHFDMVQKRKKELAKEFRKKMKAEDKRLE